MFRLIRWLVGLVVLLGIGAGILIYSLDGLVQKGIEHGGTYALGVPVKAGSASVGITSGRVAVGSVRIDNPSGFSGDPFFTMDKLETEIPVKQLLGDRIEIPRLAISGIRLSLERGLSGSNFGAITDNLKKFETADKTTDEAGKKRLVIKELVLDDIQVSAGVSPIAGMAAKQAFDVPTIRLENVGDEGQGILTSQLIALVVEKVLAGASQYGKGILPAELSGDLTGRLKGLTDGAVKDVDDKLKKLSEDPAKAVQGITDMLGGKKK